MRRLAGMSLVLLFGSLVGLEAQTISIKWGDVLAKDHPALAMARLVEAEVRNKTAGRIKIELFSDGKLGGSTDMIEAVSIGAQQMVSDSVTYLSKSVPAVTIVGAPYLWRDPWHLRSVLAGPIGEEFNRQLIATRGIRILGVYNYGTRQLTSNRPIYSVADVQGLRLRVQQSEIMISMARAWGAVPVAMNFNEVYTALKQGLVDAEENPLPTIDSAKFYQVQKYLILTGHEVDPRFVFINDKFWQKLAPADQKILKDAIDTAIVWYTETLKTQEKNLIDELRRKGMTVIEPNRDAFKAPVVDRLIKDFESLWGVGVFQKITNAK